VEGWEQTIPIDVSRNNNNDVGNNEEVQKLNALAFFDPRLLISLPVSLVKYPLSFLLKDPLPFTLFFGTIAGLSYYFDHTGQFYDLTSSSLSSPEYYYEAGGEPHTIVLYYSILNNHSMPFISFGTGLLILLPIRMVEVNK